MNAPDYTNSLCQSLGFDSAKAAKSQLGTEKLLEAISAPYQTDNGADGTILWTEIIDCVNQA